MDSTCNFGDLLSTPCHEVNFIRTKGIKNMADLDEDVQIIYLWRAGLLNKKCEEMTICFHHEQFFGNRFERRETKCCGVLKKHKRKCLGYKRITLQMAEQLKNKGIDVIPGRMFCRQCVNELENETVNVESSQSEQEDNDEVYSIVETPTKRLNSSLGSIGVSPINLHGVPQHSRAKSAISKFDKVVTTLKDNLSEAYQVDADVLNISDADSEAKEVKWKASELDRLYDLMREKLKTATYPEKVQILTLVPDKWSREKCAEQFNVSEYLIRTARDLKQNVGILGKPGPKKGKRISQDVLDNVLSFYEDDEYSRQLPGKKDCVSIGNKVQKQKRLVLCNLREMFSAFKLKYPDVKLGFSKFCTLRPKWCVLAGASGTHSVCVCSIHQNAVLLVDAIDWDVTYKDLMGKLVCNIDNRECMMHRCESCPGSSSLKAFLDDQLEDLDNGAEFHYCQWDTTDRTTLTTLTTSEYKDQVIEVINNLTKHSYLAKSQARYLKSKKESLGENEVIVLGDFAENYQFLIQDEIQSYHWSKEYCTLHPLVIYYKDVNGDIQHDSLCFISDDNTHDTSFIHHVQSLLVNYIKESYSHIRKMIYFSDGCGGQYKNYKNFLNLCFHKEDFGVEAEWVFFATSHGKSPCDGIGGAVKRHAAKRSLQRPLNNQILDYKAMLDVCQEEMPSIKFFGIPKEDMVVIRAELEIRYMDGDTVPGTRSSHHFIPLSTSTIGHKLSSDDDSFVDVHDFKIPTYVDIGDIGPSSYVTCVYNTFWWVGLVMDVDKEAGDVKIYFMHPHGPRKTFNWPQGGDTCYVPIKNIVYKISVPTTSTGRTYRINDDDYNKTVAAFSKLHSSKKHI